MSEDNQSESSMEALNEAIKKFSDEMHIDEETYKKILATSLDPTKQDLVELESVIQSEDFENIERISHRLKGTYANLRLEGLSLPATKMNDLSKAGNGIEEIKQSFVEFKDFFEKLCEVV